MEPKPPTRLELEVHFDTKPISGRLVVQRESEGDRPFTGWLGLMATIAAVGGIDAEEGEGWE